MQDDASKKENTHVPAAPVKADAKTLALKETIKKIVRANNEFLNSQGPQKSQSNPLGIVRPPISISPKEILFEAVAPGLDYFTVLTVTNLTPKQKKIKIKLPKSPFFSFDNSETLLIAPGLHFQCKISYKARTADEIHDTFSVISDDYSVTVPISVYPPRGILSFDPTINLGFVQPETPVGFKTSFSNVGQEPLVLEFSSSDEFSLMSNSFPLTVLPDCTESASFEAIFPKTGVFKSPITLSIQGHPGKYFLDLMATVVSFSNFLVDDKGNEVSILNFDEILLGDERHRRLTIVNNSPRPSQFKVQILKGINSEHFRDQSKPQTPFDLGLELSEQVIFVEPSSGTLDSYGYQVLNFKLKTSPTVEEKFIVSKFAISDQSLDQDQLNTKAKRSFNYTAFINFEEVGAQKVLQIFANAFCPLVNFSHQNLHFGEQVVGEGRQSSVTLTNYNANLGVLVTPPKESFLHCDPKEFVLGPKETKTVAIEFRPKNLGVFDGKYAFRLNRCFDVKVDFVGSAVAGNNRKPSVQITKVAHPMVAKLDTLNGGLAQTVTQSIVSEKPKTPGQVTLFGRNNSVQTPPCDKTGGNLPQLNHRKMSLHKKTFRMPMMNSGLVEPVPSISKEAPVLFVLKPVKNNEPNNLRTIGGKFNPDPKLFIREFPAAPKDYEEARQLSEKLSGEKLMRIQVGPTELNFGKVFVNSSVSLSFQVKNDLWSAILCCLNTERVPELRETPQRPQVIPSGKVACFRVVINSPMPKTIHEKVTYVINGAHQFHFVVNAEVVPVDLEISKPVINFKFKEESLDMYTSEVVSLRNLGNSPAAYKLRCDNSHSPFRITNPEGIVREGSTKDIEILYGLISVRDEETIWLEIEKGGAPKPIRCFGVVNETACDVLQGNINLGSIAVGQKKSASFIIRNSHAKFYTIFKLDESTLPEGVEVRPKAGKVCPEDSLKVEVEFMLRKRADYRNHEILFHVRGTAPLKVLFTASTVIPTVDIEQGDFDFEKITFGNKSTLPLTITNRSAIPAELFLNLTAPNTALQEKFDCVDIELAGKFNSESVVFEKTDLDPSTGTPVEKTDALPSKSNKTKELVTQTSANIASLSRIGEAKDRGLYSVGTARGRNGDQEEPKGRNVIFYLKPNRAYNFNLIFSPIKPSLYDFELVFSIPGQESTCSIVRKVKCIGTNPRFLMEPLSGVIEFSRKIIITPETVVADQRTLTISNPSFEEQLVWSLNTSSIDTQNTFTITPASGVIDPQCTVTLRVSFRPLKPQLYEASIPLFIDGKSTPHTDIKVLGEGSYPKVLFSAEEIILPATPLNVTSYGYLSLLNDGYQNSNFTISVPAEYQKLGLSVEFLSGSVLGINNHKIFIKVSFTSPTPVAFTARVSVEDDLKRTFSFAISGVSDNSLLTHGSFLNLGYFVNSMFRGSLDNLDGIQSFDPDFKNCQSIAIDPTTRAPKFSLKSEKKLNGFAAPGIDPRDDNSHSKEHSSHEDSDLVAIEYFTQVAQTIRSWLLGYGISNINSFPDDLYQSHGSQFYELLEFLLKSPPPKPVLDPTLKNAERVAAQVQQYYTLLNFLKENNAMVNTVRPYFLLSYKDLLLYFRTNAVPHLVQDYYRVSETQFRLLSLQSWTTLYLQAIKVFFVSRITIKDFKAALLLLTDKKKKEPTVDDKAPVDPKSKLDSKTRVGGKSVASIKDKPSDTKPSNSLEPDPTERENSQILGKIMPEYPYDKNSVFSASEALLLRWLEVLYEMRTKDTVRIASFGRDLQNFYYFSCAVDLYTSHESQLCGKVKANAFLNDEIALNYDYFKSALYEFGIKEEFNDGDFLPGNPTGLLLLTVHLFKTLPPYVPRSTIEFNCSLHEKIVKEISLSNPTGKTISYTVKLFGPKNFSVEQDVVKLEGKQSVLVPVSFAANTSFPVEGKIFFQNRRNGKSVAGAVVFNLRANVVNRFSMRTFTISNVNLYEIGNSEITVSNPFDKDVDFKIKIENVAVVAEVPVKPVKNKKGGKDEQQTDRSDKGGDFLPSFFIKQDRLWIRRGSVAKLYLQYLPITYETHRCLLIFLDPKVGEMQYEILGTPKPPAPLDTFRITIPIESLSTVEINVPFKNSFFSAALTKLADRIKEAKEFTYLQTVERMASNFENLFDIELQPAEFLTCPSPVQFASKKELAAQKHAAKESQVAAVTTNSKAQPPANPIANQMAKLALIPIKKIPFKDLHIKICLKGRQKFDHRFYDLFFTVLPKTVKATIEIKTTARVPVTQNIPITNNTEFECNIRPTFHPIVNGHLFEVPVSQFQVKKKSFINFPLKFVSNWIEKAEGRLTLFNTTTNDNFEYLIKVDCEEPLSENHEEVYSKAKKQTEIVLKVKNPMPEVRSFKVECDIPDADYPKRITFDESKTVDLRISFVPIIGGSFMYSATFTDDAGRYFWYLMTVHVDSPEPMKILGVTTEIRKPTACKIEIDNPSPRKVTYKVILIGDFLSGEQTFELGPNSKDPYLLYYFPLRIENVRKKVGFLSDEEGEIWYDIDCRCEESKVIKLPTFKAELGKSATQQLSFKNPLKRKSVFVVVEQTEPSNFQVTPRKFEIKPGDANTVDICFVPRELNKNESEVITFTSSEIGDWKYQVFGIGVPPTEFETSTISTALGKPVTKTFTFKNPFNQEIAFNVFVEAIDSARDLFEMLVPKQKNVTLAALATLQVIIKFSPSEIFTYRARLVVKINDNLQWVYPIIGITEAVQNYSEFSIKTKCGVEYEATNSYRLVGITNINPEEAFEHSFKISHKEAENIERWLKVKPIKNKLSGPDEELSFAFNFLPHKPFKTVVELVLTKPSGGRWKFKISLTATDPDYFDVLNIVSQLNIRKTIQFRLFNSDKKNSSQYVAYYTQDSDSEFMVQPTKGVLEPAINDGTVIEVSYLPTQYGKAKTGTLIVETEQNLWRFLVKGMFEKYVPPKQGRAG
jgi:hypothetical protein